MFVKKTPEQLTAMDQSQIDTYFVAKEAHEKELQDKAIEKALTPISEKLEKAEAELKQAGIKIGELETKGQEVFETFDSQLRKGLIENMEEIKKVYKNKTGTVEIILKVPGTITTASGLNTAPPSLVGTQLAPVQNVNLREMGVLPLTNNLNTSLAAYAYTESIPKDGDYAFVAEGALKPQIDFTWETNYATPVKAAAWMKLTEEAVQDVVGLESVAKDYLRKKHNLKKSKGILFGDGISPNPKGATLYGRAFSAGPLALSVVNPNFMDVVNAIITDIATTHNYEDEMAYMANLVLINPNDFFIQIASAKTSTGVPLYPTASLFNQITIGGVTIVPEESIPVGKIFVADMSKYNTTNYIDYKVTIGWINDDFIRNQFVILGESRFHAFVKKLDAQAFVYDTFATVKSAITKV